MERARLRERTELNWSKGELESKLAGTRSYRTSMVSGMPALCTDTFVWNARDVQLPPPSSSRQTDFDCERRNPKLGSPRSVLLARDAHHCHTPISIVSGRKRGKARVLQKIETVITSQTIRFGVVVAVV